MPSLGIIEDIKINSIHHSHYNPRAKSGKVDGLLISINNTGLLQPIVVRIVEEGFEVIAGNRRLEACRRLGWKKISCHVVELSDKEAFEVSLIENLQRKTLNPIEEAEAFRKYVTEYGWGGVSELAGRIGKSQEYVSKRMRLLNLPKDIRDQMAVNKIAPSVAEELLSVDDEELQLELGCIASSGRLTMKEVRSLAKVLKKDDSDDVSKYSYSFFSRDQSRDQADKNLRKVITILRTALLRLDEIVDSVDEDWFLQQFLLKYRLALHNQISLFIKTRRRFDFIPLEKPLEVTRRI